MDSFDEFQVLESIIQKSEETSKRNRKKPRTSSLNRFSSIDNDFLEDNRYKTLINSDVIDKSNQMEFLKDIISNEFGQYPELNHREELIRKLCDRLYNAIQNNEEIKKSEIKIARELQDMKNEMQQFSSLLNNKRKDRKILTNNNNNNHISKNNQNNSDVDFDAEDESSLELCRKQILSQSSFLSQIDYNHIDSINEEICDIESLKNSKTSKNNRNNNGTNVQMLIEQIKTLENKIQTERQSYLEENERLNSIIDEKQKLIEEYESNKQLSDKRVDANIVLSKSCDRSDNNPLHGLFDWRIDDQMCEEELLRNNTEVSNDSYNIQTNNRLLVVLSDLVKTFLDTENDIHQQLESLGLEHGGNRNSPGSKINQDDLSLTFPSLTFDDERLLLSAEVTTFDLCEDGPDLTTPSSTLNTTTHQNNNDVEDDVVLGASRRLRLAVERVLKILSDTLDHQKQDYQDILKQKEDLRIEFQEECQRSDKLTRQLMDKESLIKNLESEKRTLWEKMEDYNEMKAEHEKVKEKLEEFERERDKFLSDNKRLEMERKSFDQGLPQLHQKIIHENENLNRDIRQLQQDKKNLSNKINNLTAEVESLKTEKFQIIENNKAEFEELISQLDSKEKNLNSLKRFIEEQTQERETEREEFTKEVTGLKDKIKEKEKLENKMKSNIKSLENQVTMSSEDKTQMIEQMEELNKKLKESNFKLSELNQIKRQLESEIEKNSTMEKELRGRLKKISNVLQLKLNDETEWNELMSVVDQLILTKSQPTLLTSSQSNFHTTKKRFSIEPNQDLDNSIFNTIKLMDDEIQDFRKNVQALKSEKENLSSELDAKNKLIENLEQYKPKIDKLEQKLKELTKTNELLQQEINSSHMKYSELKVKLDSSVDIQEFKSVVNELQSKLNNEKKQNENLILKLEQTNRHSNELAEKLDAYKKEIKSFKELLKTHDQDKNSQSCQKDKSSSSDRISSKDLELSLEINQLNDKLETKDRHITLLDQNLEILKSKLNSITTERDMYAERLRSVDESHNKITIYEKNLEKLRLKNKISSDKITCLELEIQNLKKKLDILEKENEMLKIENQKLIRQKQEMNAAIYGDYVDGESADLNNMANINGMPNGNQYLNGFDKMNHISSNNLLMLKVRRLLTQKGALIYQKNYLIHVLGSYQRTENDTLALLANFNNSKENEDEDVKMSGRRRFRSIVYGLMALHRMKYMVNTWKCRRRQLLFHKTANSIASLQNVPLPPRSSIMSKDGKNGPQPITSQSHLHQLKLPLTTSNGQINSTLKDYVDRLHVVHETLGLHTNKRL